MGVKYFGQFLIDDGLLTADELADALEEVDGPTLGRLAVAKGMLMPEELDDLLSSSWSRQPKVGKIAVKQGILAASQVKQLSDTLKNNVDFLAQHLVKKKLVPEADMARARAAFATDQQAWTLRPQEVPPALAGKAHAVALAGVSLQMLPTMTGLELVARPSAPFQGAPPLRAFNVEIELKGDESGRYVLCLDKPVARAAAVLMMGDELREPTAEELHDATGEVANSIVGVAVSLLARHGHNFRIGPPRFLDQSAAMTGLERAGRWQLDSSAGGIDVLLQ